MNNDLSRLPAREIAITLMRSALALLDHIGAAESAAGLQSAIDIAEEEEGPEPTWGQYIERTQLYANDRQ